MMRGRALRYLGWQLLDRTGPRLLGALFLAGVFSLLMHLAVKESHPPEQAMSQMAGTMHFQLACLTVALLFHGIVAEDRVKGYYRFYLAKPVSPLWFYGQSFALDLAAMVAFSAGYVVIFSLAVHPYWNWSLLTSAAALGLLIGAMMFALSTVTHLDWVWLLGAIFAISILRDRFPRDDSTLGRVLHALLPPNHLVDETSLSAAQWAWVALWAVGLVAVGMWVLRRRPLGED